MTTIALTSHAQVKYCKLCNKPEKMPTEEDIHLVWRQICQIFLPFIQKKKTKTILSPSSLLAEDQGSDGISLSDVTEGDLQHKHTQTNHRSPERFRTLKGIPLPHFCKK